jgi:hypothetical protein
LALAALATSSRGFHRGGKPRRGYARWALADLPSAFVDELAAAEACDVALYAVAQELVARRLAAAPATDQAALARFLAQAQAQAQAPATQLQAAALASPAVALAAAAAGTLVAAPVELVARAADPPTDHENRLVREKRKRQKAAASSEPISISVGARRAAAADQKVLLEAYEPVAAAVPTNRTARNRAPRSLLAAATRAGGGGNERTGFNATAWRLWLATHFSSKAAPAAPSAAAPFASGDLGSSSNGTAAAEAAGAAAAAAALSAARAWWLTVANSAEASPPRANRATLVFTHVPKTVWPDHESCFVFRIAVFFPIKS